MRNSLLTVGVLVALFASFAPAEARQPDPRAMSGVPLPVGDVAVGTVVVRVIRGSLANNLAGETVELVGAGAPRTGKTDAGGRVEFTGLTPGANVTLSATIQGERLTSQTFPVPAAGGTRLLLVATDPNAAAPNAAAGAAPAGAASDSTTPAQPGSVVLGEQSRFVIEFGDGSLSIFNILQVVNPSQVFVSPSRPVVFELPQRATGAAILKDSSPQATVANGVVTVAGPFAPGATEVQFAYSLPYSGATLTVEQQMPIPLGSVIVLAQKVGEMRLTSAQVTAQREMPADGETFIVGQGPGLAAGARLSLAFSGLPHAARWPRYVALSLAIVILAGGWWLARRGPGEERAPGLERLEKRRAQLFADLTSLEENHRAGRVTPQAYAERRAQLVSSLERVFADIDRQAA